MAKKSIGIFDSGIGGLSVAAAISQAIPEAPLLYVGDNLRAPYGPQPANTILGYSREITRYLVGRGVDLIVVACNTATSIAIDQLRSDFPEQRFVGLEPAVKPAASGKHIGVMATEATLASRRYLALKQRYLKGRPVLENACHGLVPVIEAEAPGSPVLHDRLAHILQPMIRAGVDTIVLGCTHYPMVKEDIQAVVGPGVAVIDPSPAAARQAKRLWNETGGKGSLSLTDERDTWPKPGPPSSDYAAKNCDFLNTGSSIALQRSLFGSDGLNQRRRLVLPNLQLTLP